ncbi:MAG: acetamidase/formamidase family protein [Clostridiales Family XIII bacterium]|jgi:amidase|nr:acetamidase/formamidase family protein [Clostridiales Family XIII bacterium]
MEKHHIGTDSVIHRFDKDASPALSCGLPATLVFDAEDCFKGQIKSGDDTLDRLDYSSMNPCSGPVHFEGLRAGDVLEIEIKRIACNSPGCTMCIPGEGCIGDLVKKSITRIYPIKDGVIDMGGDLKIEASPMIGVIGVAPKDGTPLTMASGDFGGNMDCSLIKEGATLYLPVQVDGGLLALGDLHAAQGDGESFYTGLEVSGQVELVARRRQGMRISVPFVAVDGRMASIVTRGSIEGALHDAMASLVDFITANGNLNFYDAGFLCGLFGNLEISQVVDDPLRTARMSISLDILRKAGVDI